MDAFVLLSSFFLLLAMERRWHTRWGSSRSSARCISGAAGWRDDPDPSGVNKFSLLAIPFFVLAGAIMAEGGIANRLIAFASIFVGAIRGGLSLVNILASTFFGAISGSSVADTASIGSVMIPQMEKKGYPRAFAAAVTASGSVQAILIPPSHNAVIYSLAAGGTVSIARAVHRRRAAGVLLGITLMVMCICFAQQRNFPKGDAIPLRQALKIAVDALWGLMTIVIILGGILSGVFTATESASIAVRVGILCHDGHLPRLQVEGPSHPRASDSQDGDDGDDPDRLRGELRLHHDPDAVPRGSRLSSPRSRTIAT